MKVSPNPPRGNLSRYHSLLRELFRENYGYRVMLRELARYGMVVTDHAVKRYLKRWSNPDRERDLYSAEELGIEYFQVVILDGVSGTFKVTGAVIPVRRGNGVKVRRKVSGGGVPNRGTNVGCENGVRKSDEVSTRDLDELPRVGVVVNKALEVTVEKGEVKGLGGEGVKLAKGYDHVISDPAELRRLGELAHKRRIANTPKPREEGWAGWAMWKSAQVERVARSVRGEDFEEGELGEVGYVDGELWKLRSNWGEAFWKVRKLEELNKAQLVWLREKLKAQELGMGEFIRGDRRVLREGEELGSISTGEYGRRRMEECLEWGKLLNGEDMGEEGEKVELRERGVSWYMVKIRWTVKERLAWVGLGD